MNIILERYCYDDSWTLGKLIIGEKSFYTVERPWKDNRSSISCVPDGNYLLEPFLRPSGEKAFRLINPLLDVYANEIDIPEGTHGRYLILMHAANMPTQVEGCIAVGLSDGWMEGGAAVLSSKSAMSRVRDLLGEDDHALTISQKSGAVTS